MTTPEIFDRLVRIVEILSASFGSLLLKDWLDRRKANRHDTVAKDLDRKSQANEILELLRFELEADRVLFWLFSNGENTLNGYHLKKLSIFAEAVHPGQESMSPSFQLIPARQFERPLVHLHNSTVDYTVVNESDYSDNVSALADEYGIDTILRLKVRTDTGRWIGMVSVCYSDKRELTEGQIAFAQVQASVLGSIK